MTNSELPVVESGHSCGCGEHDHDLPELNASEIPHAIRHGSVIGAFSQVRPGSAMVLIAPHNPLPLLGQLQEINGDALEVTYLVEGPGDWKIKLARKA
jgi:uncharacterized protein (DUF2249 family)